MGWVYLLHCVVDDWISARSVDMFKSEVVSMVASVLSARHSVFKLFLDRCVVTLGPDTEAMPSCDPINYHRSEPHPSPHIYAKTGAPHSADEGWSLECPLVEKRDTFINFVYFWGIYASL